MISIIIPAHNEATVLPRLLHALMEGSHPGELEILVVCNGCSDDTAAVARGVSASIRVLETPIASKVRALNLGDEVASGFPRFYVDADVVLSGKDVLRLAARLEQGDVLAVAPRFRMDLVGCSWAVRAFYAINDRLPSSREGIGGSGVYGLSAAGRLRFESFPNLTADDAFVRVQFTPDERVAVDECQTTVFAPRTLHELVLIKTRSHYGCMELRQRYPTLWRNKGAGNKAALLRLAGCPWLWPRMAVYGYVKALARLRARRKLRQGITGKWDRDESSRTAPVMPPVN